VLAARSAPWRPARPADLVHGFSVRSPGTSTRSRTTFPVDRWDHPPSTPRRDLGWLLSTATPAALLYATKSAAVKAAKPAGAPPDWAIVRYFHARSRPRLATLRARSIEDRDLAVRVPPDRLPVVDTTGKHLPGQAALQTRATGRRFPSEGGPVVGGQSVRRSRR
jgi:hypothetical protein